MQMNQKRSKIIPIFFAVDDNYAPYLAVALSSLREHVSADREYRVYVLTDKLDELNRERLKTLSAENISVEFVSVAERLCRFGEKLHLRDYYSKATYYRFFIPELFPQYDRCLYLDCDIMLLRDAAELFGADLRQSWLAAVRDDVVFGNEVFEAYTERVLGVPSRRYFNAGILVMNLKAMRAVSIENRFLELISRRQYAVAQDQDYLNVLCAGHVHWLDGRWNATAFPDLEKCKKPFIVHFKLNFKPWHYSGISFENLFWEHAGKTGYLEDLLAERRGYGEEFKMRDRKQYEELVVLALKETLGHIEQIGLTDESAPVPMLWRRKYGEIA